MRPLIHVKRPQRCCVALPQWTADTLYLRLWLIWVAILVIGFAYVLFSDRAF